MILVPIDQSKFWILAKNSGVVTVTAIASLLDHVRQDSTVFFDIDETLIVPKTNFIYGNPKTDEFMSQLELLLNEETLVKLKNRMEEIYYSSPTVVVEKDTLSVFNKLYDVKCKVYGITSRYFDDETTNTLIHRLIELGFHFSQDQSDYKDDPVVFHNGIIFSAFKNKGELIDRFFAHHCTFKPKNIVFIDDSLHKCEEVASTLKSQNITVLHYTGSYDHITHQGMQHQYNQILNDINN